MIAWLKRLFTGRMERKIFRFHDGRQWRYVDPLVVQRDLDSNGGEGWPSLLGQLDQSFMADLPVSETLTKIAQDASFAAAKQLIDLTRKTFDVEPLSDNGTKGLTDTECLELLGSYMLWMQQAEADARPLQSSPQS